MAKLKKRVKRPSPDVKVDKQVQKELEDYLKNLEKVPQTFDQREIVTGEIVSMSDSEIIVDVGGRSEGVVEGKEMRLEGIEFEKEEGDKVLVYVIKGENEKGQIELSIRRTGIARKWYDLKEAQDSDSSVSVTAIEANSGGLIVDVGGGLRGFIPTSQLDSSRIYPLQGFENKQRASQELQNKLAELINEKIEVKIIEIDREKNRVIFSEKLVTSETDLEMREETLSSVKVGDELEAEVTGIAPFGLFVNAEGLEGLVHLSEISWDKVSNPANFYKVGDKVKVQVIGIEEDGKRVAYSIKRLKEDPWEKLVSGYKVGQIVEGIVTKVVDFGAFVRIGDGLNGLVHISELSDKLVRDPANILSKGDEVKLMIISISREDRHLGLSLKRAKKATRSKAGKKVKKDTTKSGEVAPEMETLREILGE